MEKITPQTKDITAQNIANIAQLFPQVITEKEDENGNTIKAIDFELLKQHLSKEIIEGSDERYRLDWPGKRASILKANTPITSTLKPDRESSVNFDTTENVYIEGDNFEVLKILQESYLGKIKMIYIDPPYNTGNDFVYKDNFKVSKEDYETELGTEDEEGGKLFKNTDTNGRFHSDWLSMIYERLLVARDLLTEDGVIFMSIGQNEISNLIKLSDEIFGEENRISIVGRLAKSGGNKGKFFSPNIEYIVVMSKSFDKAIGFRDEMDEALIKKVYTKIQKTGDKKGEKYRAMGLYQSSLDPMRGCVNQRYYVEAPDGTLIIPPGEIFPENKIQGCKIGPKSKKDGVWRWTYPKYIKEFAQGNVEFSETNNKVLVDADGNYSKWNVNTKIWLKEREAEGQQPNDFISKYENRHSSKELKELDIPFDFAKPIGLVKYLTKIAQIKSMDIILDFFSGSGTTAHSIMQLNAEDEENRKFIMVQLPEKTDEKSEVYKAGYKTIPEIGKERIRRAGNKILEENREKLKERATPLDLGFRVYKTSESILKEVAQHPNAITQTGLFDIQDNIKENATDEDILTAVILDFGEKLDNPIEIKTIAGATVFLVDTDALVACFSKNIDMQVVEEIAKMKPLRAVFRDACFKDDKDLINTVESRFKQLAPNTKVHVI